MILKANQKRLIEPIAWSSLLFDLPSSSLSMDPVGEVAILEPLDDFSSSSDSEMMLTKSSRSSFYYSYLR